MWFKHALEVIKEFESQDQATPATSRISTPEDIAFIIAFLADADSRWRTGSIFWANGVIQLV
jgi:NAD(P)-dependent dehydrogenase (short-subunit alcohol dehydrogenase family)